METVKLPAGVWVNLNIETGITTGVQLDVVNITPTDVKLASTLIAPTVSDSIAKLSAIKVVWARGQCLYQVVRSVFVNTLMNRRGGWRHWIYFPSDHLKVSER